MINRRKTRQIKLGNVFIGGGAEVSIQSMCTSKTEDANSTIKQIKELVANGCDIVRVAVNNYEAVESLGKIRSELPFVPLVADIHFDYKLAIGSLLKGVNGIRINPGNIGSDDRVKEVIRVARENNAVIRIGLNSGSLPKGTDNRNTIEAMLYLAKKYIELFSSCNFENIKFSLKCSDVMATIEVYERFSNLYDFPLHLGITEAGTLISGTVKSSLGIGILLYKGIGDTIRVSLSADPIYEVDVARKILKYLNLKDGGVDIISCPTCGRSNGDVVKIASELEQRVRNIGKDIKVAVMGCEVNGPGEAKTADIGVAFGKHDALLFKRGEILKKISKDEVLEILLEEIEDF